MKILNKSSLKLLIIAVIAIFSFIEITSQNEETAKAQNFVQVGPCKCKSDPGNANSCITVDGWACCSGTSYNEPCASGAMRTITCSADGSFIAGQCNNRDQTKTSEPSCPAGTVYNNGTCDATNDIAAQDPEVGGSDKVGKPSKEAEDRLNQEGGSGGGNGNSGGSNNTGNETSNTSCSQDVCAQLRNKLVSQCGISSGEISINEKERASNSVNCQIVSTSLKITTRTNEVFCNNQSSSINNIANELCPQTGSEIDLLRRLAENLGVEESNSQQQTSCNDTCTNLSSKIIDEELFGSNVSLDISTNNFNDSRVSCTYLANGIDNVSALTINLDTCTEEAIENFNPLRENVTYYESSTTDIALITDSEDSTSVNTDQIKREVTDQNSCNPSNEAYYESNDIKFCYPRALNLCGFGLNCKTKNELTSLGHERLEGGEECYNPTNLYFGEGELESSIAFCCPQGQYPSSTGICTECNTDNGDFIQDGLCYPSELLRGFDLNNLKNLFIPKVSAQESVPIPDVIDPELLDSGRYELDFSGYESAEFEIYEDQTKVKYYNDVNGDGRKQEEEPYINVKEIEVSVSKTEEVRRYEIERGWNLIGLPFVSRTITTASKLVGELARQGVVTLQVSKYEGGNFVHFVVRVSEDGEIQTFGQDFNLVPGEGYFVRVENEQDVILRGNVFTDGVDIRVNTGWNLKSIQTKTKLKAIGFLERCNNAGIECSQLVRFNSALQQYDNPIIKEGEEYFGNDYDLKKQEGYFILNSGNEGILDL